jgi:hypothetical protein
MEFLLLYLLLAHRASMYLCEAVSLPAGVLTPAKWKPQECVMRTSMRNKMDKILFIALHLLKPNLKIVVISSRDLCKEQVQADRNLYPIGLLSS